MTFHRVAFFHLAGEGLLGFAFKFCIAGLNAEGDRLEAGQVIIPFNRTSSYRKLSF